MNQENVARLEQYKTRELLGLLKAARTCGGRFWISECSVGPYYTIEEIKHVLADRPHIPNKREAKELRRKKAQGKL